MEPFQVPTYSEQLGNGAIYANCAVSVLNYILVFFSEPLGVGCKLLTQAEKNVNTSEEVGVSRESVREFWKC